MNISTMNELFKKAIRLDTDTSSHKVLYGLAKPETIQNLKKIDKRFNTSNGILAFTSNGNTYVIPNFNQVISLLKNEGFRQDYVMPVPDASKLQGSNLWKNLITDYQLQFSV